MWKRFGVPQHFRPEKKRLRLELLTIAWLQNSQLKIIFYTEIKANYFI